MNSSALPSLVVVGAAGHGREAWEIALACREGTRFFGAFELLGFLDDGSPDADRLTRIGARHLGPVSILADLDTFFVVGIGDPATRRRIDALTNSVARSILCPPNSGTLETGRPSPATLVHPSAIVGHDVVLGPGCVVAQGAVITTNVRIGRHTHLNVRSSVSHDCTVGDFVTISPGATVCGTVAIADEAYLGAGSCILPNVSVGTAAMIGAGAVVTTNVPARTTVVGVPARALPRNG